MILPQPDTKLLSFVGPLPSSLVMCVLINYSFPLSFNPSYNLSLAALFPFKDLISFADGTTGSPNVDIDELGLSKLLMVACSTVERDMPLGIYMFSTTWRERAVQSFQEPF